MWYNLENYSAMIKLTNIGKAFYRFYAKPRAGLVLREILLLMSKRGSVHILQVGANDGVMYDPIHEMLKKNKNITATRIEPLREYFEELEVNCRPFASRVNLLNMAVAETDGLIELHFPDPRGVRLDGEKGHASINPELAGKSRAGWISRMVPCKTFRSLIDETEAKRVDVYVSDCEGFDVNLLAQLPIRELGIKVIFIELMHQGTGRENLSNSLRQVMDIVACNDFNRFVWDGSDFLAWRAPRESSSQFPEVEGFGRD